jgi:hypothetical protein
MAQQLSLKTHEFVMRRGTPHLSRVHPYVRLYKDPGPEVYVQDGNFYSSGGPAFKKADLPDWLQEELAKLSPACREEVGLKAA